MTPEERDIIGRFIARVGGNAPGQFAGSVPTTQTSLPPIDPEADRFIGEQFASHPEARYRITQFAFVQEAALAEAQNRIKRLEYELQQVQQQQAQPQPSKGLFGGLFGGGQSAPRPTYQQQYAPPPPQPTYAPGGYQPGMFQSGGGSGFLGSALTTAAGVAGGMLAADAISSMFSPHGYGMGGGFGGGGFGGMGGGWGGGGEVINETTVNNYGSPDAGAGGGGGDPWSGAGTTDSASWDQGGGGGDAPADDAWSGGGDSGGSDSGGGDAGWDDSGSSDSSF